MPDPYREVTTEVPEAVSKQEVLPGAPEGAKEAAPAEKKAETAAPAKEAVLQIAIPVPAPLAAQKTAPVAPLKDIDQDRQLKMLVDLAFAEGIDKAVEAARSTENAYLVDKLHDTLVDELAEKLKSEGRLKEI